MSVNQSQVFACTFIAYATLVLHRRIFSLLISQVVDSEQLTAAQIGSIISAQNIAFGLSKFVLGVYSDTVSPVLMLSMALVAAAASSVVFAQSRTHLGYVLCQTVNGVGQGGGWPATAKLIVNWWPPRLLGSMWSLFLAATNVVNLILPLILPTLLVYADWRCAGVLFAIIFFLCVDDKPDSDDVKSTKVTKTADRPKVPWRHLLTDTTLWQLAVYFMFAIMVKTCVDNWTHMYIVKERQLATTIATHFVAAFEAGGLAASVFTGMFTDWLVARKHRITFVKCNVRLLCTSAYMAGSVAALQIVFTANSEVYLSLAACMLGVCTYGNINILGICATESSPKYASGSAHALVSGWSLVGAVIAGLPLGHLATLYSWTFVFRLLQTACVLCFCTIVFNSQTSTLILKHEKRD